MSGLMNVGERSSSGERDAVVCASMTPSHRTDMLTPEHKRLVASYIAARTWIWTEDRILRKEDDSDWATGALYDAVWEQPALGWELIREICRATSNPEILEELANGPLHQLLVEHPQLLHDIERDAQADAAVSTLLSYFYEDNALPDELKERIYRASDFSH